jgi:transcriptional regulator with XRE-family HTH domain
VNPNRYTHEVARTKKTLTDFDRRIAEKLLSHVEHSGMTRRQLAAATGMSMNRIGIILRQEAPAATVGELGVLAESVGTSASAVLAEAEHSVLKQSDHDLVANDSINEFPEGEDADFDGGA